MIGKKAVRDNAQLLLENKKQITECVNKAAYNGEKIQGNTVPLFDDKEAHCITVKITQSSHQNR